LSHFVSNHNILQNDLILAYRLPAIGPKYILKSIGKSTRRALIYVDF